MKNKKILLLSAICGLSLVSLITASVAWFVGIPTIESNIDSDIKDIAGYFDSNTGEGNGEGTSINPFIITKPVHFHNLMRLQNESKVYSVLTSSVYFQIGKEVNGSHYVYTCGDTGTLGTELNSKTLNMKMYEGEFDSIGTEARPFKSKLISYTDITISNLTVNSKSGYAGLFGYISNGTATNVVLNDYVVNVTEDNAFVGFLAGYTATTDNFTGCKVNKGTFNKPNTSYTMSSKFGYFGKAGNISDSDYAGKGTSTKIGLNASDITNENRNTFADWQYDHNDTRENYTDTTGHIDDTKNFSSSIDGEGYVQNGNVLSNYGHVKSENSRLYYNNGSSIEEISQDAVNNGTTAPTITSDPGEYFYKGSDKYKYSEVEGQGSKEGSYNVFLISSEFSNGTVAYLKYQNDTLAVTTTAPGPYNGANATPEYYFSIINNGNQYGVASLNNNSVSGYIYSPSTGKTLFKTGTSFNFYYNSGIHGEPTTFTIGEGIVKTISGIWLTNSSGTPAISTTSTTTYFSFQSSNTNPRVWNAPIKKENANATIAATGDTYTKVTSAPSNWAGEYLLVYENSGAGYVWTGVDATSCYESRQITNDTITQGSSGVSLTIASVTGGYSIKINDGTNKGKYITYTNNANGLSFGNSATAYTLSYESGSTKIANSGGAIMRYNKASDQNRFRFYKSSSYTGQQAVQLYKLNAKTLSSISVKTAPTKTTYIYGEKFNPTGLVITKTYSDSTSEDWSYSDHSSDFTFNPSTGTALTTSNTKVTITVGGQSVDQSITVGDGISDFRVVTEPSKTKYTVGEVFDSSGLVVKGKINGEDKDITTYSLSGNTTSSSGPKTVTVTYTGSASGSTNPVTDSFTINVYADVSASITSGPDHITHYADKTYTLSSVHDGGSVSWSISDTTHFSIKSQSPTQAVVTATQYDSNACTTTLTATVTNGAGKSTTASKTITMDKLGVESVNFDSDLKSEGVSVLVGDDTSSLLGRIVLTSTDHTHTPDNTNVTFSIVDADPVGCATINSSTGAVHGVSEGMATIVVTSSDNPSATDTLDLFVFNAATPELTPSSENIYELKYDNSTEFEFEGTVTNTDDVKVSIIGPGGSVSYDDELDGDDYYLLFAPTGPGIYTVTLTPCYVTTEGTPVVVTYKAYTLTSLVLHTDNVKTTFEYNDAFNYSNLVVDAVYTCGNDPYRTVSNVTPSSVIIPSNLGTGTTFTSAGTGNVTVSYTDSEGMQASGTYSITVYKKITSVSISTTIGSDGYLYTIGDGATIKMLVGETKELKANITPSDATSPRYDWSSNVTAVATATNPTYHTVTINARSVGTTTITLRVKADLQSEQIVRTVNIEVVESLAASQTPIIPSIPFTGENKVSNYDLLVNFDNDANYEVFNPYDTAPTFYKDSEGYWCVCAMKGRKVDTTSNFVPLTNMSQLNDYSTDSSWKVIITGSNNTAVYRTDGGVEYATTPLSNDTNHNNYPTSEIVSGGGRLKLRNSAVSLNSSGEINSNPLTETNLLIFDLEKVNGYWKLSITENGTKKYMFANEQTYNEGSNKLISISDDIWDGNENWVIDSVTAGGGVYMYNNGFKDDDFATSTEKKAKSKSWLLSNEQNNGSTQMNGNFDIYKLYSTTTTTSMRLPRLYISKTIQEDTIEEDFIVDNVSHTDSTGTYNPFTKTGARFDIVGGTTGTNAQAMQLTENSINITTTSSKSYSAAMPSGNKFDPNRLANTILTYIPKTGAYDLGTIKLTTAGSKDYGFVRSTGGVPLSSSNYVNSTDLSSLGADTYISFNTGNINKIAYCGLDASGNYCSLDSASLQTYVIAITARQGKTINIASIEYEFNSSVCNNIHIDNIPFIFAFSSSGITSLDMTYSSTYNRYNFTVTSSSNYYIDFINHNVLKQSGDSTNPCYLKCNGSVITSGVQRYYNT